MPEEFFGPYRIEALLGRGGMGEVHRAFDTARRRVVALKRLPAALAAQPAFQARFRTESQLAARLNSAHVVPIHDFGEIDGQLFIDMRLVEGRDLGDRLARGPLAPAAAVAMIEQIAAALDAAHRAELEHRDVKPSNILLSATERFGGEPVAYLVDFGIARAVDHTQSVTGTGELMGTLAYMAPERFVGAPADHRVDVYALAAVLSESMTGAKPFRTDGAAATMYAHLHLPPPRPSLTHPGVPPAFDDVIARGMAKNPAERPHSAGALAAAARSALTAPVPAGHPGVPRSPATGARPHRTHDAPHPGPARRRRGPVVLTAFVLAVAVAVAGVVLVRNGSAGEAPGARPIRAGELLPVSLATGMAMTADGRTFFVTRADGANAWRVERHDVDGDGRATAVVALPTGGRATDVDLSPSGTTLAVATSSGDLTDVRRDATVVLVDVQRSAVTAVIPMPAGVADVRFSVDGSRVLAAADGSLVVVDPVRQAVERTVPTGQSGVGSSLVPTPDGRSVIVSGSVGVRTVDLAAGTVTGTIGLRGDPSGIAVLPDGRALVATPGTNSVAVLEPATGRAITAIPVGAQPDHLALTPDGSQVVVSNSAPGTLTIIDIASLTTSTVPVGGDPDDVAFSADGTSGLVVIPSGVLRLDRS